MAGYTPGLTHRVTDNFAGLPKIFRVCAGGSSIRFDTEAPFFCDGFVWATNGTACVRAPQKGIKVLPGWRGKGRRLPRVLNIWPDVGAMLRPRLIPADEIAAIRKAHPCQWCDGTGHPKCNLGHYHKEDCCNYCMGGGCDDYGEHLASVMIGRERFSANWLAVALKNDFTTIRLAREKLTPAYLVADKVEFILMPFVRSDRSEHA